MIRKEIQEAWIECLQNEINSKLPKFKSDLKLKKIPGGLFLKFTWRKCKNLWCILGFRLLDGESFDVLVGWSRKKRLPYTNYLTSSFDKKDNLSQDFFMAFSIDYAQRNGSASWSFWEPSVKALDDDELFSFEYSEYFYKPLDKNLAKILVLPSIKSAVAEIKNYCIPYLERIT